MRDSGFCVVGGQYCKALVKVDIEGPNWFALRLEIQEARIHERLPIPLASLVLFRRFAGGASSGSLGVSASSDSPSS